MNLLYTYPAASKNYKSAIAYCYESLKSELPIELIKEWFTPVNGQSWDEITPKPVVEAESKVSKLKTKATE